MLTLRFTHGDQVHQIDFQTITVNEWIELENATGATPPMLSAGIEMRSATATKAFYWLARRRTGATELFNDLDFALLDGTFKVEIIGGKPQDKPAAKPAKAGRGNVRTTRASTGQGSTPAGPSPSPTT